MKPYAGNISPPEEIEPVSDHTDVRQKIMDGAYPFKIVEGRQRKHIEGTREFEQKRAAMQKLSNRSEPAKLKPGVDPQRLVDQYKGTGEIYMVTGSPYPREDIKADTVIGETWVKSLQKYVDTSMFTISYSSIGVHIILINERGRT